MQTVEIRRTAPVVLSVAFMLALLTAMLVLSFGRASAATLNKSFVRFDRMKVGTATTGTVCASPTTVASTEGKVAVTFPTGYTVSTSAGNWTTNTTNLAWPTFAGFTTSAWPTISAPTISGQTVTWTSGDLTSATTIYCFNWNNSAGVSVNASASPSNSGTIATQTAASAAIDSANFSTASISDDQISVSASVPQTFSFSLSANSDTIATLSTGAVTTSTTARTVNLTTNAKNGWNVWANDANTGLTSTSAGKTIASTTPGTNSTLSTGVEGYNTGVTGTQGSGNGTLAVAAPFVGGSLGKGGGLNTGLALLASSNGSGNNVVLTLNNNASIDGATPAATDYADLITVVGAGLF